MARIVPDDLSDAERTGRHAAELATLRALARELPDDIAVFHSVHWTRARKGLLEFGEIDFVVLTPQGKVLAIEQKNGTLQLLDGDLVKIYEGGPRSVTAQTVRNVQQLREAFRRRHGGQFLTVAPLYYFPDWTVTGPLPASIDPESVVDARASAPLSAHVLRALARMPEPNPRRHASADKIAAFLADRLKVVPSVDAIHRAAHAETTRLSGGLAVWARRLDFSPFRLRVIGTAGSGKTQLALEELRAAERDGKGALYVCFNRPLAQAMRTLAPAGAVCETFHGLGRSILRQRGDPVDPTTPGAFERYASAVRDLTPETFEPVDVLVVDEGQDLDGEWAHSLFALVPPEGRIVWLEDPQQALYARPSPVGVNNWVTIRSPRNYRSPRAVVDFIERLALSEEPVEPAGPIDGEPPGVTTYHDDASLVSATARAVRSLVCAGHKPQDIAVISWRGRPHSRIADADAIDGHPTRRATGAYDADGNALTTDGPLRLETLRRFKGQAADCIVLTEVDFDAWTDGVRRALFVAVTRAHLKIEIVATEQAAALLEARADSAGG